MRDSNYSGALVSEMTTYQLAIFSNGADPLASTLKQTVLERLSELGVSKTAISFFDSTSIGARDPKAPTVGAVVLPSNLDSQGLVF